MVQEMKKDPRDMLSSIGASWGWILAFGIITLLAGIATVVWPGKTVIIVGYLFGIQIFVAGIFRMVYSLGNRGEEHRILQFILGLFSLIIGVVLVRHLYLSLGVIVLLLGVYWIVTGIMDVFGGILAKDLPHRGWTIATGVLAFIAGMVVLGDPGISLVTLAWILGIWLIVYGVMLIVGSMQVKKVAVATGG
jgi:uncharacterized membrane protein HdeD (DUF308 family)